MCTYTQIRYKTYKNNSVKPVCCSSLITKVCNIYYVTTNNLCFDNGDFSTGLLSNPLGNYCRV